MRFATLATTTLLLISLMTACQQQEPEQRLLPTRAEIPSITPSMTSSPSVTPSPTITMTPSPSVTPLPTDSPTPVPSATLSFYERSSDIDRRRVMEIIADLQNFGTRHANAFLLNDFQGLDAAQNYLREILAETAAGCAAPANLYEDNFSLRLNRRNSTQTNFVAEVRGTDPSLPVIIVGAHYDTVYGPDRDRFMDDDGNLYPQPGADDNGSGVAATLELMRLICLEPRQRTLVFVLFAAEEVLADDDELALGRNGSRHFARQFIPQRGWQVEGMINVDTIGTSTDSRGAILNDFARLFSADPVSCCARQMARSIQAMAQVQLPDFRLHVETTIDRSNRWGDHMSFTEAGYNAVRLFESSDLIAFRDTSRDLINLIDPAYLSTNIQVVLSYLLGMSEGSPPPATTSVDANLVSWPAVPGAQEYLIAQRPPNESNYVQFNRTRETRLTLPPNTIFAVGSIGANGLLGPLSEENYVEGSPGDPIDPEPGSG